jgi:hypothetical protein
MPGVKVTISRAFEEEAGDAAAGIVPAAGNPPEPDYFVTASRIRASADP